MVIDIAFVIVVIHTTVFGGIAMTKDPISCNSPIDYKSFTDYMNLLTQKVAVKVMIGFVIGRFTTWDKRFGLIVLLIY